MSLRNWVRQACVMAVLVVAGGGCATQAMKGTPFYSGEWEQRSGPVEDRVALWPFVYYRAPALSVLWPIFEKTPDHLAVRPLYKVTGLESGHKVHNVLWPLGRFDSQHEDYRFFPFFWGDDYLVGFPLYWHFGHPVTESHGCNSLFPLWIYSRPGGKDGPRRKVLHLVWPLARFERGPRQDKNRVFPLFWQGRQSDGNRWFYSLPLGTYATPLQQVRGSWVFPLYAHMNSPCERYLHTLLGGNGRDGSTGYGWLLPMLGGWSHGPEGSSQVAALGLWYREKGMVSGHNWLLPLYWRQWSPEKSSFYTLLGGGSRAVDGSGRLITPFYMRFMESPEDRLTVVPPALAWQRKQKSRTDLYLLGGLSRFSSGTHPLSSYLFPLWYRQSATGTLLTPVFQKGGNAATAARWNAVAPLYYHRESETSSVWATPLGAVVRRADGTGRTLTPFYVHVADSPDETITGIPPLLSWRHRTPGRTDDWLLLGLGRRSHGETPGPSHLFPLWYRNPATDSLLSPLWARWPSGNSRVTAVPPLVSWRRTDADGTQATRLAGGLASVTKRADGSLQRSHLFPLYYINRDSESMLSPLYASWRSGPDHYRLVPPLLAWQRTHADQQRDTRVLAGLGGWQRSAAGEYQQSYLFPLYTYSRQSYLYTPLYGHDGPQGDFTYWLTPLAGHYRNGQKGHWLFPVYRRRIDEKTGYHDSRFLWGGYRTDATSRRTSLFPLFNWRHVRRPTVDIDWTSKSGLCQRLVAEEDRLSMLLLFCRSREVMQFGDKAAPRFEGTAYRREEVRRNRLFPFWHFEKSQFGDERQAVASQGSLLWKLYDVKKELSQASGDVPAHDYVRRRVLWRFWHYERLNGELSVDSFPFITYDRKPDGFRKTSFAWRVFRYEKHPDGTRKLDLLFVPLWRRQADPVSG